MTSFTALSPRLSLTSQAAATPHVTVDPLVVLTILDHYKRRNADKQHRVIGTLIGTYSPSPQPSVHISDCYAVPHSESVEGISIDMEYSEKHFVLKKKTYSVHSPKFEIVGWYATADAQNPLNDRSTLIHHAYRLAMKNNNNSIETLLLTVDTGMGRNLGVGAAADDWHMCLRAYTEHTIHRSNQHSNSHNNASNPSCAASNTPSTTNAPDEAVVAVFQQVNVQMSSCVEESVAVEQMMKNIHFKELTSLQSESASLLSSVNSLVQSLEAAEAFVQQQLKSSEQSMPLTLQQLEFAFQLNNVINSMPVITAASMKQQLTRQVEDLMMVLYCSELVETQLALSDKVGLLIQ